jgi:prepilin-type N-terminal cleavage/methylation domain-containing protein
MRRLHPQKGFSLPEIMVAVALMAEHLQHVEDSLMFERTVPSNDVAQALR